MEIHLNCNWENIGNPSSGGYATNNLSALFNRVINSEITIVTLLHRDGGKRDTTINLIIPSGYKNYVASDPVGAGVMNYYYKNVGSGFGVVSMEVVSITCSDKSYYFTTKVDTTTVLDFKTSVYFISNKDTLRFNNYSYQTISTYSGIKSFAFNFGITLRMMSDSLLTPLYVGQSIHMPYLCYYGPYTDHGTQVANNDIAPHSGSTVSIVITRKDDKSFDATFSGKVWSAKEMDTLFIKGGQMLNVKLPQ